MTKESPDNYKLKYPHFFSWNKQVHLIEEGDILNKAGRYYRVTEIYRSPIKGQIPVLKLEELPDT